jgi:hypothetical protein
VRLVDDNAATCDGVVRSIVITYHPDV